MSSVEIDTSGWPRRQGEEAARGSDPKPQEVFSHQAQALGAEDLEQVVADSSDDAVFITPAGVQRGEDGFDTFVFRDGLIRVSTVRYTLSPLPEGRGWRCDRTSSSTPRV